MWFTGIMVYVRITFCTASECYAIFFVSFVVTYSFSFFQVRLNIVITYNGRVSSPGEARRSNSILISSVASFFCFFLKFCVSLLVFLNVLQKFFLSVK